MTLLCHCVTKHFLHTVPLPCIFWVWKVLCFLLQGGQAPYENSCVLFQVRSGKWINQPCSHYQPVGPAQVYPTICEPNQAVYIPNRQIIPGHETSNIPVMKRVNGSHSLQSSGGSWNGLSWLKKDSKQNIDLLKSFLNSRYKSK